MELSIAGGNFTVEQGTEKTLKTLDTETAKEEMDREFSRPRARGFVVNCDGEHAVIYAEVEEGQAAYENYWCVGQLVSIKVGQNRVVGLCCAVESPEANWIHEGRNELHIKVELVGEIYHDEQSAGNGRFSSGITSYPHMGCIAHRIRGHDLEIIYRNDGDSNVSIGHLTQDEKVPAKVDVDKLLSRHFAIVGTTGVGKSTSVTLLMRKIIKTRPDVRVLMLDPHNEFASAFPNDSVVVDSNNLLLPFWLFKLDELSEVIFRGQSGFEQESELLRDLIPLAMERYKLESSGEKVSNLVRRSSNNAFTADAPVPYRIADLMHIIEERLGLLEGKAEKPYLRSLQYRLESIVSDPRFKFMFEQAAGGDVMEEVIAQIFRVPTNGRPICVLEMSGLPSEVVSSVVSVLCRLAFDLAMTSDGGIQTLVVCEEAHRYIPAERDAGFWPTRQSIARIAKEGRKYGVYLSIITQRPGELDPTILSQCSTVFAMRLGNEKDQEIIRGAVTNGAKSTIGFLSSIANRECIAFGEAIHTPMRMTFETMPKEDLPGARIYSQQQAVRDGKEIPLPAVIRKMRQEDRRHAGEDADSDLSRQFMTRLPEVTTNVPSPGDDINDILNAVYPAGKGASETSDNAVPSASIAPDLEPRSGQNAVSDGRFSSLGKAAHNPAHGEGGFRTTQKSEPAESPAPRPQPAYGESLTPKKQSGRDLLKSFRSS